MGVKGAPAYFQEVMANEVLSDLLHTQCELYMDDCMVYASTTSEYLKRLEAIFARFRAKNITLNPDKCRLGLSSVEYLGHVLDHDGVTFSSKKIDKVIDLPKPMVARDLKQFLGLINYFHKHLQDIATVTKPLHEMIKSYKKSSVKPLVWTTESEAAYERILDQLRNLPKLYYLIDGAPTYLYTDASQVGLGGYLYQIVNVNKQPIASAAKDSDAAQYSDAANHNDAAKYSEERPIAFISTTFKGSQVRWHTVEKESYAIYYCLHHLKHLLGNRQRNGGAESRGQGEGAVGRDSAMVCTDQPPEQTR
jgi:hypothetical protein